MADLAACFLCVLGFSVLAYYIGYCEGARGA
jgi:hypothetical protein